ncbi:MAG: hypothetical protein WDW38_009102 [Sanguina aurantia]
MPMTLPEDVLSDIVTRLALKSDNVIKRTLELLGNKLSQKLPKGLIRPIATEPAQATSSALVLSGSDSNGESAQDVGRKRSAGPSVTPPGQPRETDTSEQQAMRLPATSAADTTQPPARLPQEPTTTTTTTAEAPAVGQPSVELAKKRNRPCDAI